MDWSGREPVWSRSGVPVPLSAVLLQLSRGRWAPRNRVYPGYTGISLKYTVSSPTLMKRLLAMENLEGSEELLAQQYLRDNIMLVL